MASKPSIADLAGWPVARPQTAVAATAAVRKHRKPLFDLRIKSLPALAAPGGMIQAGLAGAIDEGDRPRTGQQRMRITRSVRGVSWHAVGMLRPCQSACGAGIRWRACRRMQ